MKILFSLPPTNEVCEGYVFTGVCLSTGGEGGHAWLLQWGHVWLLRGHVWLLQGGMCGCSGGVPGCSQEGGHAWLLWGGHAWLLGGCGCSQGGVCGFFDEIRSMSGRYASYWNAFLFMLCFISKKLNL